MGILPPNAGSILISHLDGLHDPAPLSFTGIELWDVDDATSDPSDDLLDSRSITIAHPPGTWDGILIPYETSTLLALLYSSVAGNYGSSGEQSAEVYQYVINPGWGLNLSSEWITVP